MRMKDWIIFYVGTVIVGALLHSLTTPKIQAYQATTFKNMVCQIDDMNSIKQERYDKLIGDS